MKYQVRKDEINVSRIKREIKGKILIQREIGVWNLLPEG